MKKIIISMFLMFLISFVNFNNEFSLKNYFTGEYLAYCDMESEDSVNLGFCQMGKNTNGKLLGESVKVENFEVGSAINLLNAKVNCTEILEDGTIVIYAYTDLINTAVVNNGVECNLQIAVKEDIAIIGWPLILGSF